MLSGMERIWYEEVLNITDDGIKIKANEKDIELDAPEKSSCNPKGK